MARVFRLNDGIDTDQLAPGEFMHCSIDVVAAHCLESVRPDFVEAMKPGDIIVAGLNFGLGSSREQAAEALKHLGIRAVIARSFAGIFYRNAINLGLPVLVANDIDLIREGDNVTLDLAQATLVLGNGQHTVKLQPLPPNIKQILADGGLVPHLKKRLNAR